MILGLLPHQLAYIDGASRCTACGKLGLDISITGQMVCAGSPSDAEPADMTAAESERVWSITRSLSCD